MFLYTAAIDLVVNRVDLFGKPVALNFNGKDKSKSFIGAFFSGVVLVFFVWALYIFSQDMFQKKNPKTIMSQSFHENPDAMVINADTFAFAFGLQDPQTYFHYINSSIYTVEVTRQQLSREVQPDGSLSEVWSSIPLEYETCTTAHFGHLGSKFASIELNQLFCLKKDQPALKEIVVQGVFESPKYQYIQTSIKACDNVTSGGTCGTSEELKYYLGGGFFATYFTNLAIDPKNYKQPNVTYRDSYYSSLTYPYYKELTLWLNHLEVKSDVGWLLEEQEVEKYISFEKTVENLNFRQDLGAVLNFVVRVDKIKTHYERSYTKISDVFAEVNGLGAAIIVAFAFFLRPYSDIKFNEGLINELFEIKGPDMDGCNSKPKNNSKTRKRSNSKKNSKKLERKNSSKAGGVAAEGLTAKKDHLKIEIGGDKSAMNSILNSPCDSFNITKTPVNDRSQSPTKEVQFGELNNTLALNQTTQLMDSKPLRHHTLKMSSPPSMSMLDSKPGQYDKDIREDVSTFRAVDTQRAENFSLVGNSRRDSGTYRSQLLQAKPLPVKPTNKILEHYEAENPEEIEIVLENLIHEKKEETLKMEDSFRKMNESIKKKTSFMERTALYRADNRKEDREDTSQIESMVDEGELKVKAKELPEKLCKSTYKINITFWEYLHSYFWKSKELKEKFRLLNEGIRRIEERLDIFKVFKKFREVDKMRLLLFESEQLVLFDSLPKPELASKDDDDTTAPELDKSKSIEHIRQSRFINEKRRNDLIALSYENMKKKMRKSIIDDRLLDIYDSIE